MAVQRRRQVRSRVVRKVVTGTGWPRLVPVVGVRSIRHVDIGLVCGGNIDVTLLSRIIERGLVKDGRLVRLRIHLADHPGSLQRLTVLIAEQKANIVETKHDRAYYGVNLGDTVVDITMETKGADHVRDLMEALVAGGYPHDRVQ